MFKILSFDQNIQIFEQHRIKRSRYSFVFIVLGSLFVDSNKLYSQTLDEQIKALLSQGVGGDFCSQLVGSSRDQFTLNPTNFGPQLTALCGVGAPPGGVGGVSLNSFSGSALSTLGQADQFIKKRRLRKNSSDNQGSSIGGSAGDDTELAIGSAINLFFNADYRELDRKQTVFEQGYSSNQKGFNLGGDLLVTDWLLAGIAFNYSHWRGDQLTGGGFETDSYGPTVFASLFPWKGFFADLSFQYSRKDGSNNNNRSYVREDTRAFGGSMSGTIGANQYEGNFSTGYDYSVGGFTIGPRATVRYRHVNTDSYTEQGNTGLELRFLGDKFTSVQSIVGAQASINYSTSWGVLIPQLNADWTHEYYNGQRSIYVQFAQDFRPVPTTFSFQTDKPDRDFFHLGAGLIAVLPHDVQVFANFETLLGNAYFDNYVGSIGFRLGL